ncbi:SRPBCC family protein [Heyndrickxia sporothermodurans]
MNNQLFIYTTYIATTSEKLWFALTKGQETKKYFFGQEIQSNWQEGTDVKYIREDGSIAVYGKILKCEYPSFLSFTWEVAGDETPRNHPTRVLFNIKAMGSMVKLSLKHEGIVAEDFINDEDTYVGLNNGWPAIISNLKTLLETGKTLPI